MTIYVNEEAERDQIANAPVNLAAYEQYLKSRGGGAQEAAVPESVEVIKPKRRDLTSTDLAAGPTCRNTLDLQEYLDNKLDHKEAQPAPAQLSGVIVIPQASAESSPDPKAQKISFKHAESVSSKLHIRC